jgi:hypothetical protein
MNDWFVVRDGLAGAARFPSLARSEQRVSAVELLLLLMCGATAAVAIGMVKLRLGIPGHSIVLAAVPMALGMALAPRRMAGCVMSGGALGAAWLLTSAGGGNFGSGSFVSLSLLGPMMDLALNGVRGGRRVYGALILAGLTTNLLALTSRAVPKVLGLDVGARPWDSWWLLASVTYTLSGIVAGLLGAICWFHFNDRKNAGSIDRNAGPQV